MEKEQSKLKSISKILSYSNQKINNLSHFVTPVGSQGSFLTNSKQNKKTKKTV